MERSDPLEVTRLSWVPPQRVANRSDKIQALSHISVRSNDTLDLCDTGRVAEGQSEKMQLMHSSGRRQRQSPSCHDVTGRLE